MSEESNISTVARQSNDDRVLKSRQGRKVKKRKKREVNILY